MTFKGCLLDNTTGKKKTLLQKKLLEIFKAKERKKKKTTTCHKLKWIFQIYQIHFFKLLY